VPEGVTLLEFGELAQEEVAAQLGLQNPAEEENQEELPECPDHRASTFVQGKPRSI
jgi:hypothetical protein